VIFSCVDYAIKISQSPSMTLATFIRNIGGQVGLWLGISSISIIQLFALFYAYFCDKCRADKRDLD